MLFPHFLSFMRFCTCLFVSLTTLLSGLPSEKENKLFCPLDERPWKIGFENFQADTTVIELVPQEQDVLDWQELFTVQIFQQIVVSAKDFVSLLQNSMDSQKQEGQKIIFEVLEKDPTYLIENSFINHSSSPLMGQDEYNLGRVIKNKETLYYIRYSTKNADLFAKNKPLWTQLLKRAYVAPQAASTQTGHWLTVSTTNQEILDNGKPLRFQTDQQVVGSQPYGFAISLPKTWLTEEKNEPETSLDATNPYTVVLLFSQPEQHIYGGLAVQDIKKGVTPLKPRLDYLKEYKKLHPEAKLVDKGDLKTVLGVKGKYLILTDQTQKGWITFFKQENRIYRLEFWTKSNEYEGLKKDLEKIILNFQFRPTLSITEK